VQLFQLTGEHHGFAPDRPRAWSLFVKDWFVVRQFCDRVIDPGIP
jgi:hypothetical protein